MIQIAAQVVGEFGDRRVALVRVLLQRLGDDRVEVSRRRRRRPSGVVARRKARSASTCGPSPASTAAADIRRGSVSTIARTMSAADSPPVPTGSCPLSSS